jgi:hypothetical protein
MEIPKTVQDAAYVTVGVGVLAFQQAQVRRREAQADLEAQVQKARGAIARQAKDAKSSLETATKDVCSSLETAAKDVRTKAEALGSDVRVRVEPIVDQLQTVPVQVKQVVDAGTARARELVGRAA